MLLDVDIPGIGGLDLPRRLRRESAVPVIVISGYSDERSVVVALRSGADDYVVKPVRLHELLARVEVISCRAEMRQQLVGVVRVQDILVDLAARTVQVGDTSVELTTREFDVLAALARQVGTAVSRGEIMNAAWGTNADLVDAKTLNVHANALRTKLARPRALQTIRGFGYRLG